MTSGSDTRPLTGLFAAPVEPTDPASAEAPAVRQRAASISPDQPLPRRARRIVVIAGVALTLLLALAVALSRGGHESAPAQPSRTAAPRPPALPHAPARVGAQRPAKRERQRADRQRAHRRWRRPRAHRMPAPRPALVAPPGAPVAPVPVRVPRPVSPAPALVSTDEFF